MVPFKNTHIWKVVCLGVVLLGVIGIARARKTPEWQLHLSTDKQDRIQAVKEISKKSAWRAKRAAYALLEDSDPDIVHLGLSLIVHREFTELSPDTYNLFVSHPDSWVRAQAVTTLAALESPELTDATRKALQDEDETIRLAGANAVGASGLKELAPVLIHLLTDAHGEEKSAVLRALINLKEPAVLPHLLGELQEEEYIDAGTALNGLVAITNENHGLNIEAWEICINTILGGQ